MPHVIAGPVALALFNAGAPIAVANAVIGVGVAGVILHTGISVALTIGASYAVAKLTAPKAPKPSEGMLEFKQPIPSRFHTYGLTKISGPVLLLETENHRLNKITAFGARELAAFDKFFIDGNDVTEDLTSNPIADNWWNTASFVNLHIGTDTQTADADAITSFSAGWTSDHRLRGIPYVFAKLDSDDPQDFNGSFPNGEPQFSIVGGVKVYDPRKDSTNGGSGSHRTNNKDTWEFSENAALCCLDFLTWPDGYNKGWDRIHWPSWLAMINLCDEAVPLKGSTATEPRYRIATKVSYDEPRSRVLHRILQAMDGQLYPTSSGLIGIRGGVWQEPTVSLDVGAFPEGVFTHGVGMMDRVNEFSLSAMLPSHDFGEVDLEPWANATDPEHIAGFVRRQPLELTQVPSNGQAQRLAKIYMAKHNPRWTGQVRTDFAGLDAIGASVVDLSFSELDQPADSFNGPFWINGKIAFLADKTGVTFPVAAADPDSYEWDAETEEQDPPPLP